ncbi:TolC family protein [Cyclobacterium amurskyense]|uniref:TolC family protein n=1 Tax=Cyclobacterium amurskyense TaxID=320787 RepID=UPI0030DA896C|tara:strand:- start:14509 stop:15720 length:1212 start_codon:yes stop_codon:yes gene_type:complete
MNHPNRPLLLLICLVLLLPAVVFGQEKSIDLKEAMELALKNNRKLKATAEKVAASKALAAAGFNIDKTQIYYRHDQNDIAENGFSNKVFGISQNMLFPTIYGKQKSVFKDMGAMEYQQYLVNQNQLKKELSQTYYTIVYLNELANNYFFLDSLYQQFSKAADRKFEVGETNYLEKLTAKSKKRELEVLLSQTRERKNQAYSKLAQLIQSSQDYRITEQKLTPLSLVASDWPHHPGVAYFEQAVGFRKNSLSLEKSKLLPDLHAEVYRGTNSGLNAQVYPGVMVGISVPLWFGAQKAKISASKYELSQAKFELDNYTYQLEKKREQLEIELKIYQESISFYNQEGKRLGQQMLEQGNQSFQNGEIDFFQFVVLLENSRSITLDYLNNLQQYNMTVLEINYLTNP